MVRDSVVRVSGVRGYHRRGSYGQGFKAGIIIHAYHTWNVTHHAGPEQGVAGLELTLVDVDGQRHDGVAFITGINKGQDGHKKTAHGKSHVVKEPKAVLRLRYRTGT